MNPKVIRSIIALLSAGWLAPLWLGVRFYLDFMQSELWPAVYGQPKMNSFPFLEAAKGSFTVTCIWLGVVVYFWAYRSFTPKTDPGSA